MKRPLRTSLLLILLTAPLSALALSPETGPESLATRTYHIRYHKFDEVLAAVNERLSERGEVSYRRAFKEITVRDLEEVLRAIDAVVREMDIPPKKVEIQITIFEASRSGVPNDPPDLMGGTASRLRNLMTYTHFDVLGTNTVPGMEGESTSITFERPRGGYKVQIRVEYVDEQRNMVAIKPFELFREQTPRDAAGRPIYLSLLSTSFNPRADQPLLVGGARSEDAPKAIFCALRVRILE